MANSVVLNLREGFLCDWQEDHSCCFLFPCQDMYDELIMIIGSRRSGLNQNLALKGQYEQALRDLADLIETGKEKMTVDQKMMVSSKEEVQMLLDKHKVKTVI